MGNENLANIRFKELRERSGLTQVQIANFLNIDQSYVSKFEKGERKLTVDILEKICNLYGCTLKYFENEEEELEPMSIAFRSSSLQNEDLETIAAINKIALNLRSINSTLEDGNVESWKMAVLKDSIVLNSNALKMRRFLNEDVASPIDIFSLLQNVKGVTLVFYPMSDRLSGICLRDQNSKLIAINSNMSYGRQRFTAAHELYHLYFEERSIVCEKDLTGGRKFDYEKVADIFASYLLAPYDSLRSYLEENNMLGNYNLTIEDIINLEQFYQLNHQAMLYRLVSDGYISWEAFNQYNVAVSQTAMRMGYDDRLYKPSPEDRKYYSIGEYVLKVETLKKKGLISNGKYEELLLDAFRADIVYNLGSEGTELND